MSEASTSAYRLALLNDYAKLAAGREVLFNLVGSSEDPDALALSVAETFGIPTSSAIALINLPLYEWSVAGAHKRAEESAQLRTALDRD